MKVKIEDDIGGIKNLNELNLDDWLADHYAAKTVLAFSIHGGQEYPNTWDDSVMLVLQPGEGILFTASDPLETVMGNGDITDEIAEGKVVLYDGNDFAAFEQQLSDIGITSALLAANVDPANVYQLSAVI